MEDLRSALLGVYETIGYEISPNCHKIAYAGGVRREKPDPHDMEMVVLPKWDTDLFGERVESHDAVDLALAGLVERGVLAWDMAVKRNGERYKRFLIPQLGNFVLEMFFADEWNWGNQLAIRTGDAEFSRRMVTSVDHGGWMPRGWKQDRYLFDAETRMLPCGTEREFFDALGVKWIHPRRRSL